MPISVEEAEKLRGCWIEGHRGWAGSGYLVQIASSYGMPVSKEDSAIVDAYLESAESLTLSNGELLDSDGIWDAAIDLADQAENWLNENVAPDGWAFGWYDGEFYFWPTPVWEEE